VIRAASRGAGTTRPFPEGALVCAALALLAPAGLAAQAARELTVEESVQMGLEHNARLRAARADVDAARAGERQVAAARLPALRSQASYGRLSNNIPGVEFTIPGYDSTFTFQGVQLDRLQTELSLELPLLAQLRLGHETRAAGHDAAAVALGLEQERSDVAFDIRRAYWNLHRAQEHRATVQAALAGVEAHLQVVRERVEEGAALTRDLLAAETRRSEVLLEQVEADNAVRVGQLELNRLIGLPLDEPLRPVSEPPAVTPAVPAPGTQPAVTRLAEPGLVSATLSDGRPRIAALERQVLGFASGSAPPARPASGGGLLRPLAVREAEPVLLHGAGPLHATWELGLSGAGRSGKAAHARPGSRRRARAWRRPRRGSRTRRSRWRWRPRACASRCGARRRPWGRRAERGRGGGVVPRGGAPVRGRDGAVGGRAGRRGGAPQGAGAAADALATTPSPRPRS